MFSGSAECAIALGTVAPDPFADARCGNTWPHLVDHSCAVAMRDHLRIGHAVAEGVPPLLDVAGIDAGCEEPDSDFAIARHQVREFRDLQHFPGRALPLIPSCSHRKPPSR